MASSALGFFRAAALAILCAGVAHADPQPVSFPGEDGITLRGWLYAPATPGAHRAIVALHGCGGLDGSNGSPSPRHADWGERWAAAGYIALFPDSYGSRGLGPQCKNGEREVRPAHERVDDANAALQFLTRRADVDARQISLVGWSNGGSATLYAVESKHRPAKAGIDADFARAIAFYPGCRLPLETGRWRTRIPLLILIGAADDWTPAAPCSELIATAKAGNEPVEIETYAGAYHDFDHPGLAVHEIGGLAFTANGGDVAHSGSNPAARAAAIARVTDFLRR